MNDPGKVVWSFDDFTFPQTPPGNVAKEVKSGSLVLRWPRHLIGLPHGTDLSLFYNASANFTPIGGRVDAFGSPLPPPRGTTAEHGINISAFNDRLGFRLNRFKTTNAGVTYGSAAFGAVVNAPLDAILRWSVEGNVNPHLVAERMADIAKLASALPANFLQLYNVSVSGKAPNLTATRNSNLAGAADTTDFTATGMEFEVVCNPTSQWRILANVARQETIKSNVLPFSQAFQKRMAPIYDELAGRAAGNYPVGWRSGDPLPSTTETFATLIDRSVRVPLATELASQGVPVAEQRTWRVNAVATYSFGRGSIFGERLRGWSVGGGVRWQSRFVLGYPSSRNADTTPSFDRTKPYYAPAEVNGDLWVRYERRIWDGRIQWRAQINVVNLYGDDTPVPIGVQPWGEVASVRLAPERRWYLTNTFSF